MDKLKICMQHADFLNKIESDCNCFFLEVYSNLNNAENEKEGDFIINYLGFYFVFFYKAANKSIFYKGQIVKYAKPEIGEENARFMVLEISEPQGQIKEKLTVQYISDLPLPLINCFFSDEFIQA